jgi:hypothetical protein
MITFEGEITELTSPPNKVDNWRSLTIWLPEANEHIEMTISLEEIKKEGLKEGDMLTIKVDKKLDIDSLTQDLLKID